MKQRNLVLILCSLVLFISCKEESSKLFVGTFSENGSEGLYSYSFNSKTGELNNKKLEAEIKDPSFLTLSDNKKYLYVIKRTEEFKDSKGAIIAYKIKEDGIEEINTVGTGGGYPCHVGVSKEGNFLAASCYSDGSLSIYKVAEDGSLKSNPQYINHKILDSIKKAKAHASIFTPDGLFTADLGLDAVKRYTYNGKKFVPGKQASLNFPDGAGPRHFKFSKDKKFLYVINELNSTITVLNKNEDAEYTAIETKSTLDKAFKDKNSCADIHLSKDGNYLYGSNRGENTIVIFKIDKETGKLTLVGRESVHGDWPRNFVIDPSNTFLLVANQKTNNISVFKRNIKNGTLSFLQEIKNPSPVCLEFLE
ncbi:6-phosphogluconolactonase [Maribacter vaceletii]|uniref:6-phosphogluconolactonase n=1 Tax=Maribacter vaceletii TaxID=1206816 RepID=A0A495ECQ9_9FLAO|nr:lactonase family protein [Maribacter vaceletii]RKR14655.1 6-phosphogluconolactonase [Maribacter vaceletii]